MRRSFIALGIAASITACIEGTTPREEHVAAAQAPLIAEGESYTGADLGEKELALTFDDGPGLLKVSGDLAEWLHARPTPIQATFFVNGACIAKTPLSSGPKNDSCSDPNPEADAVLAKEVAEGHYIGNHTTTHRDLVGQVLADDGAPGLAQDLAETDGLIAKYTTWNRLFFRAPYGSYNAAVFDGLKGSAMNKYAGPVYWVQGGGPTDANRAADWECWQKNMTSKACGDLYLKEIAATGNKGIVLMHDAVGNVENHDVNTGTGNTADMVKYIVPQLEAAGFKFKRLDEVPAIAAVLPKCDSSCAECKGPAATECTACSTGKRVENGACVDGAETPGDGGSSLPGRNGDSGTDTASNDDDGGCSISGRTGGGSRLALALAGMAVVVARARRRRRQ